MIDMSPLPQLASPPGDGDNGNAAHFLPLSAAIHAALAPVIEQYGLIGFVTVALTDDSLVYSSDLPAEQSADLLEEALDLFHPTPVPHGAATVH